MLALELAIVLRECLCVDPAFHNFVVPVQTLTRILQLLDLRFQLSVLVAKLRNLLLLELPLEAQRILLSLEVLHGKLGVSLHREPSLRLQHWNQAVV